MSEQGYNGWTNYETWVTKLWIDNDQGEQDYWLHEAKDCLELESPTGVGQPRYGAYRLADMLKEAHEEAWASFVHPLNVQASVFHDLMNASLSQVNWVEIAESFIENSKEIL
jgi:hypothetical protein